MVSIERRFKNSNDKWEFDSTYYDGLEGGKKREKEYAKCYRNKNDGIYEYKVKIDGTHKKIN